MKTKTERREAANELYLFWYKLEQESLREYCPNRKFIVRAAASMRWKNQTQREK